MKAAERSVELATKALDDYTLSPRDRKAADDRLRMGNFQRSILLATQSGRDNDFYIYRYLATEAFCQGTTSPSATHGLRTGGQDGKSQRYIQRARFLGISEFARKVLSIMKAGRLG